MENYINKFKNYGFEKRFKSIVEISPIRLQKLLHMSQDAIFIAALGLIIGRRLNNLFPKLDKNKKKSMLILESLLHILCMLVVIYYLIKIVNFVPFLFSFGDYSLTHRSKDGENSIRMASTVVIALVFNATQTNLKEKILFLSQTL